MPRIRNHFARVWAIAMLAAWSALVAQSAAGEPTSQPDSSPDASRTASDFAASQPVTTPPASQPTSPIPGSAAAGTLVDPLGDLERAVMRLIDDASPCVVAIAVERRAAPAAVARDPFVASASGSGVIIRADGMILTNQHVISDAATIHVTLHDGRRLRARRVAADPRADLAVIAVAEDGLAVAPLADARNLRRGAIVLALGNPLGLAADGQAAAAMGIVSAIARPLPETFGRDEDRYYGDMIQTTAQIHPGHSGGPLIDRRGRVVGIIAAASLPQTGAEPIAFAIPLTARTRLVIDKLLNGVEPDYGYAGVRVGSLAELRGRRDRGGVLLETVFADGPAHAAGLRDGDIVLAIEGSTVDSADEFVQRVGAAGPERTVEMEYERQGRRGRASVTLARRPPAETLPASIAPFIFRGATLGEPDAATREAGRLPTGCLMVLVVASGSPADRAGLTPGDVIVRIEGRPVAGDAARQFSDASGDVLLGLSHGGSVLVRK